jgi:hypothetical protein
VVAEKTDRISRQPLPETELLIPTIRAKGARHLVAGIGNFTNLVAYSVGMHASC